jgi:predicted PurR-regulated permease PerM
MTRPHFFAVFFFAIFLFLLYQLTSILAPFSSALIWATILTVALHPIHERVLRMFKGRAGLAAFFMTLLTMLVIIVPSIILLTLCASQAIGLYDFVSGGTQSSRLIELWNSSTSLLSDKLLEHPAFASIDIKGLAIKGISEMSSSLASQIGTLLKNTLLLVFNIAIMLIALFFFFKNGESYYRSAMDMVPFAPEHKKAISKKIHDTFTAVLNGVFLIALIQGIVTGIGLALFGVPYAIFWGFLAAALALLPVGGAALVWVPAALYLFSTGANLYGILLICWGLILVTLPDNFLKPVLIGKKADIPAFFLFIGILGGLKVYGILGILFGPLVVTLLAVFIQIYREEYVKRETADTV